jgi:hypothetical protein
VKVSSSSRSHCSKFLERRVRKLLRNPVFAARIFLRELSRTGKKLIARAIHKRSARSARALIGVNCAAIPRQLIASELFGHEKRVFTGANRLCSAGILYAPNWDLWCRQCPGYAILSWMLKLGSLSNLSVAVFDLWLDTLRFIRLSLRSHLALAAENLFLRQQLALYLERQIKPRRAKVGTRLTPGVAFQTICVATGSDHRQARHFHPVAPPRLSTVLAVEIETPRTAAGSRRTPEIDRGDS